MNLSRSIGLAAMQFLTCVGCLVPAGCKGLPQYQPALSAGDPPPVETLRTTPPPTPANPPAPVPQRRPDPPAPVWRDAETKPREMLGQDRIPRRLAECYAFIACASASNPGGRFTPPIYVRDGVPTIVQKEVLPLYEKGWRRFYLDSPFGKDKDEKGGAKFTFFGSLREGPDSPWRRGFVSSWRTVTAKPGVRVVAYLGNPYADAEYKRLAETPGKDAECRAMLEAALAPILDAKFTGVAIDASSNLPEATALGALLKDLHARGVDIFIEATPKASQPWLTRFGTIRTTWFARGAPTFQGFVDVQACAGERIQLFEGTPPFPEADRRPFGDWAGRWINGCFAGGERPAFGPYSLPDPRTVGLD